MIFFIFEVIKKMPIHAIQYGLVGGAIAIFYLLLVALSEHFSFALAYSVATIASTTLLSVYVSGVLNNTKIGTLFGGIILSVYGTLYCLVGSEDYALLLGSGLLFIVLAVIMILTRHIDWYVVEGKTSYKQR
jgi:inner membrane protein